MLLLLFMLGAGARADSGEPVTIEAVRPPDGPAVVVRARSTPVAVPACRGVIWQRFDPDTASYAPLPAEPCGALTAAQVVGEDGVSFRPEGDLDGARVIRAVVVVGEGCRSGLPLPLASCAKLTEVAGPTISLSPPAAE